MLTPLLFQFVFVQREWLCPAGILGQVVSLVGTLTVLLFLKFEDASIYSRAQQAHCDIEIQLMAAAIPKIAGKRTNPKKNIVSNVPLKK